MPRGKKVGAYMLVESDVSEVLRRAAQRKRRNTKMDFVVEKGQKLAGAISDPWNYKIPQPAMFTDPIHYWETISILRQHQYEVAIDKIAALEKLTPAERKASTKLIPRDYHLNALVSQVRKTYAKRKNGKRVLDKSKAEKFVRMLVGETFGDED